MLTATLRGLEADGLVVRTATPSGRVLYSLSPVGQTLVGPLDEVFRWGQAHHTQVEESRLANGRRTQHGVRPKVRG
jgi:DNA-binding HxlR family transcriptional regulator